MRNLRSAHRDESLNLGHVQHRHDAGDDRILDPHLPGLIAETIKILVVEEKLRDDEITTGIELALQILQIARAIQALRMSLRVSGHADTEVMAASHETGQL